MHCPTLKDLPEPPSSKTGWPWAEESGPLPPSTPRGQAWPRITVVTPSFNQGRFLEETIRSILLQGYPDLEYIVMDGGSTDGSVEIIKKYSPWITTWVSEPDGGQSAAINRGLGMGSGLFATWINSDDLLCQNAIVNHATHVGFDANTVYVGFCGYIDTDGKPISLHRGRVLSLEDLVRIRTVWRSEGHKASIDQPAVLFPRALALSVGGLNADNHYTMDYELWGKFFLAGARFQYTDVPFGMFRQHEEQKTHDGLRQTRSLIASAATLTELATCFSEPKKKELLSDLNDYFVQYKKIHWRQSGRLARIGLPPYIVNPVRAIRAVLQKAF